jgi:hypothetical protein
MAPQPIEIAQDELGVEAGDARGAKAAKRKGT